MWSCSTSLMLFQNRVAWAYSSSGPRSRTLAPATGFGTWM